MSLSTVTPPAAEPFDAAGIKPHLREELENTEEDALLGQYIATARRRVETFLRKRLITQTVRLSRDGFGDDLVWRSATPLPIGPIQSVEKVDYLAADGSWTTLAASDYRLIQSRVPNELHPAYGKTWPVPRAEAETVRIDLVVGYGDAGDDVPDDILQAVRMLAAHYFANREAVSSDAMTMVPEGVREMLTPHVLWV